MKNKPHVKPARLLTAVGLLLALLALGLAWLGMSALPAYADPGTIYVDGVNGTDQVGCGNAPGASACATIGYTITNAVPGDVVSVAPAVYTETETISMRPGVIISGSDAATTIINGNGTGPVVGASGSSITSSAVLRGFTIRGGSAADGGGLYITSGASPTVEDCIVRDNQATNNGGGLYVDSSVTLVLSGTQVISNTAGQRGGGLYQADSAGQVDVTNGRFERNVATNSHGGGLFVAGSATLSGTQVLSNIAGASGGGLCQFNTSGQVDVTSGRFECNLATNNDGGGLFVAGSATLSGTQVVSNTAGASGGGLFQYDTNGRADVSGGSFERNVATNNHGGGLYVAGRAALTGTQVVSNTTGDRGGGLYAAYATLTGTQVVNNIAGQRGGGLYVTQSAALTGTQAARNGVASPVGHGGGLYGERAVEATNGLFVGNYAIAGAGLYMRGDGAAQATLRHLTVVSATLGSGTAVEVRGGTVHITNTIVSSYSAGISYQTGSTVTEDYNLYFGNSTDFYDPGTGTLISGTHSLHGQDPRFVNPAADNYHIGTDSAALDAGAFLGVTNDLDGAARPTNTAWPDAPDIGCYENKSLTVRRTVTDTMTFGAACARIVFTDTGSLSSITVTVVYTYPTGLTTVEPLPRYYVITPTGSGLYTGSLTLCYTQQEFDDSDVDPTKEAELRAYRYNSTDWEPYSSTVDTGDNLVTATLVTTFSQWALGGPGTSTAVDLTSFTAAPQGDAILVSWETATELDRLGFDLYRATSLGGPLTRLNEGLILSPVPGSPAGALYTYLDELVNPGATYYYWLDSVGVNGVATRDGPVSAAVGNWRIYLPLIRR